MRALNLNYPNKYYIETGLEYGESLQTALNLGVYEKLFSVEIDRNLVQIGRQKFANNSNIMIIEGDSSKVLPSLLVRIDAPATFWLDGHYEESCR